MVVERFKYALINLELWRNGWRCTGTRHGLQDYFEPSTGKAYLGLDVPFQVARIGIGGVGVRVRVGMYLHLFFPKMYNCNYTIRRYVCESKKQNQG